MRKMLRRIGLCIGVAAAALALACLITMAVPATTFRVFAGHTDHHALVVIYSGRAVNAFWVDSIARWPLTQIDVTTSSNGFRFFVSAWDGKDPSNLSSVGEARGGITTWPLLSSRGGIYYFNNGIPGDVIAMRQFAVRIETLLLASSVFALPTLWFTFRRKRSQAGCCLNCGYDLRAHVPGQRCPECGTTIPPTVAGVAKG